MHPLSNLAGCIVPCIIVYRISQKFEYGSTGIYALGNGEYYFSHDVQEGKESWSSTAYLYRADNKEGFVLA